MATQQDKKKPVSAKKAALNAKLAANLQLDGNPTPNQLQDVEERRTRLKALIVLGKERGYLTFAEINDHLPEMLEVEQIEGIVSMINDMGISVSDQAPDAENMVMSEGVVVVVDEDAVEAGVQAVGDGNVDKSVLAAETDRRLSTIAGERPETGPATAAKDDYQNIVVLHGAIETIRRQS